MKLDVVTFGEVMSLLLAEPGLPLRAATWYRRSIAGAEANVAVGLARLGHPVGWFGRVGDDALGAAAVTTLRGEGVDVSRVSVDPAPTGVLIRDSHAARPIEVIYARTASAGGRLSAADVDDEYIRGARVLHLTGITAVLSPDALGACRMAMEVARAAGVLVSLDPNVRLRLASPTKWRTTLAELLPQADLVLAGDTEARLLADTSDDGAATDFLLAAGARFVVTKRGPAGAVATDGVTTWSADAVPVQLVDPIGAGDAFAAGYLSAWLRGLTVDASLIEACAVGASAVQVAGDQEGLPTSAGREAMLARSTEARR